MVAFSKAAARVVGIHVRHPSNVTATAITRGVRQRAGRAIVLAPPPKEGADDTRSGH